MTERLNTSQQLCRRFKGLNRMRLGLIIISVRHVETDFEKYSYVYIHTDQTVHWAWITDKTCMRMCQETNTYLLLGSEHTDNPDHYLKSNSRAGHVRISTFFWEWENFTLRLKHLVTPVSHQHMSPMLDSRQVCKGAKYKRNEHLLTNNSRGVQTVAAGLSRCLRS